MTSRFRLVPFVFCILLLAACGMSAREATLAALSPTASPLLVATVDKAGRGSSTPTALLAATLVLTAVPLPTTAATSRPLPTIATPASTFGPTAAPSSSHIATSVPTVVPQAPASSATVVRPAPTAVPRPPVAGGAPARSAVAAPVDLVTTAVHALSLEQKVGQLILIGFDGPLTPALKDHLRIHHFGGFLTVQMNINAKSPAALTETINTMQDVMDGDPPLFIATDQEGGTVCLKWASVTCFPGGRRLGLLPPDDAAVAERDMSEELYAMGFNLHLAPVADVWDGVHPFMIDRSYGTQAEAVSERVRAVISAGHTTGLAMTVKHFPGHGGASDNSHIVLPTVDHSREYLDRVDLPPFQAAIDAGVDVVMMGHLLVPAIDPDLPTSLSPKAHAILRDEWGYQGVIMSDDIEMGAIVKAKSPAVAAVEAVKAGTDMVIIARSTASQDAVYRALLAAVQDGRIPQERLDRSVERILRVKMKYRLSENRHSDPAWAASFVGAAGHRHDAAALIAR